MKKIYLLLSFLFISTLTIAQGISVQGIARDNTNSAVTDTNLTFTFSITKDDNTVQYAEAQSIKTDNFGVFSHIVSTGNPVTNTFNDVDFSLENLKIKVSVNYNSNDIEVYSQEFQYVPYAKYAENGVPTGTVVSFLGTTAPRGWLLCDGGTIPTTNTALKNLLGTTRTPDLRGMFLRGTGQSVYGVNSTGPSLKSYQANANISHAHNAGSYKTDNQGIHNHNSGAYKYILKLADGKNSPEGVNSAVGPTEPNVLETSLMSDTGSHAHNVQGSSAYSGGTESRPVNYGVNYIIKL